MAMFQTSKRRAREDARRNWMGGRSHAIADPVARLRMAAASCFFGEPMYYHRDPADDRPARSSPRQRRHALSEADLAYLRETLNAIDGGTSASAATPGDGAAGERSRSRPAWPARELSPAELLERAIDDALDADPEAALRCAAQLRADDGIRTTPQVILVRAANHPRVKGTGLVRRHAPSIIARADEPAVGLAYQLWRYGKPVPNALKRAWRDALARMTDYQLAKHRLESRAVKTADVINLVHPASDAVAALARGELRTTGQTWESIVSAGGGSARSWAEAVPVMGHMALLRNLRNLLAAGVPPDDFAPALVSGVRTGKQLPFRYYSAYRAVATAVAAAAGQARAANERVDREAARPVLDALETCIERSLDHLPALPGRTMALCDNSGSAQGTTTSSMGTMQVSTIANLSGVLAGMRSDEGHLGVFGDRLETFALSRRAGVLAQLDRAEGLAGRIGGATENGIWLFWSRAIRARERWDTVFVLSDMQAGHGGLYGTDPREYADYVWRGSRNHIDVARLIATYRERVNPDVDVFLVQVAGYHDAIVPETYDRTYILGGWSDGLLRYADRMRALRRPASAGP